MVNNVAPTATFTASSPINEGSSSTLSFTAASDPSSTDTTAGFHYSFACDGLTASLASTYASAGTTSSTTCPFADNGSYPVKGRIFDKDGGYTDYSATVVVNNVSPTVSALTLTGGTGTACLAGNQTSLTFSFSDAGANDAPWAIDINWGDATAHTLASTNTQGAQGPFTHTYGPGVFTVTVKVTDKDGGFGIEQFHRRRCVPLVHREWRTAARERHAGASGPEHLQVRKHDPGEDQGHGLHRRGCFGAEPADRGEEDGWLDAAVRRGRNDHVHEWSRLRYDDAVRRCRPVHLQPGHQVPLGCHSHVPDHDLGPVRRCDGPLRDEEQVAPEFVGGSGGEARAPRHPVCASSSTGQDVPMTDRPRRSWFAAMLALIGGAVIVAGSLLTWLEVGGGVSVGSISVTGTPKGSELLPGQVALGAGVAVIVFGLLLLVLRRARRLLGFLVILGGIVAIAAGAFVASSPEDRYIDFAVEKGAPAGQSDEVRASLTNLFVVSGQEADLGIGLYIAIGGGALALIGGLTAVFGRRKPKQVEEARRERNRRSRNLRACRKSGWPLERWRLKLATHPSEEPPPQELVTQTAPPPLPDPPPEPEEAAPWRSPLPEAPESPPDPEACRKRSRRLRPTRSKPRATPGRSRPLPLSPSRRRSRTPEPSEEPAKPDDRADWSKPLPDDWAAKPAKRRRRRRS